MKNITLTRNGQTAPRDVETSTMHADGLVVGQGVMLRIKGDCCPGMKPTPYKEYVVTAIKKTDRFDKKCSDVTFTVATKAKKPANRQPPTTNKPTANVPAVVPEVVPMEATSGVAQRLTALYRRAESSKIEFVRHAVAFGVMLMEAEADILNGTVSAMEELVKNAKRGQKGRFCEAGASIEPWLAQNCPEINYKTAQGYKSLASKMVALMGGETPEVMAALAAPSERLISYEGVGAETDSEPGEVLTVSEEMIQMRDEIFASAPSRRKLQQLWLNLFGNEDGAESGDAAKAANAPVPKLTQRDEAAAIWTRVMGVIDKTSVMDAVPLLPQKAAKVCYDRLTELARAMKAHLEEF